MSHMHPHPLLYVNVKPLYRPLVMASKKQKVPEHVLATTAQVVLQLEELYSSIVHIHWGHCTPGAIYC